MKSRRKGFSHEAKTSTRRHEEQTAMTRHANTTMTRHKSTEELHQILRVGWVRGLKLVLLDRRLKPLDFEVRIDTPCAMPVNFRRFIFLNWNSSWGVSLTLNCFVFYSLRRLFDLRLLGFVGFLFLLVSGKADCGTPWTFFLPFFLHTTPAVFVPCGDPRKSPCTFI